MKTLQQTVGRDLAIVGGKLVFVSGVKAIATKLRNRLLFFSGEWFLDTRLGVPWFLFFEKNPDLDALRRMVMSVILGTSDSITDVPQLDLVLESDRTLRIVFQAVCDGSLIEGDTGGDFFVDGNPIAPDPAPVLTSVSSISQLGGTVTVTGSNFLPSAVLWTDGVARATTYVSSTSLTAVVPAHAVGSVNAYVAQTSGISNTVPLTYTASLVDPATLNLTGYWAQRGDASDYVNATGTWTGRASIGPSLGRNLTQSVPGNRRTVTSAVDGKFLVRSVFADGKSFETLPGTIGDYFTATAAAGVIVFRVGTNSLGLAVTPYPQPPFMQDASQYTEIAAGLDTVNAGKVGVAVGRYTGSWASSLGLTNLPPDTIMAMCWRHAGGKLQLSVNTAPSAALEVACGTVSNIASALQILTSSTYSADFVSIYLANTLTDQNFTDIINWEKAQLPTSFP